MHTKQFSASAAVVVPVLLRFSLRCRTEKRMGLSKFGVIAFSAALQGLPFPEQVVESTAFAEV
jgi:hypothetical protein